MKQKFNSGGRPPKINSTAFRCSVNFTATEQAQLLTMQEKSGIASMSAFIKMRVFGKPLQGVCRRREHPRLHRQDVLTECPLPDHCHRLRHSVENTP